jgi:hypothetical protein
MSTIASIIDDYAPADGTEGVPLNTEIFVLFSKMIDETDFSTQFFIEGPDTDAFVGPDGRIQVNPTNVSQGDDFLSSPGYKGIVQGTISYKHIDPTDDTLEVVTTPYRTKAIFTPAHPLVKLTNYVANIPEVQDTSHVVYTGYYTFSWTSGSGSITALPTLASTSVLIPGSLPFGGENTLSVLSTNPDNHSVQVSPDLSEVIVTFDKDLDDTTDNYGVYTVNPSSLITIIGEAATNHPDLDIQVTPELTKSITIEGNKLTIKI